MFSCVDVHGACDFGAVRAACGDVERMAWLGRPLTTDRKWSVQCGSYTDACDLVCATQRADRETRAPQRKRPLPARLLICLTAPLKGKGLGVHMCVSPSMCACAWCLRLRGGACGVR